jgi:hypothetical protein
VFDEIPHSEKVLKRHQNNDDPCIMAWDHYNLGGGDRWEREGGYSLGLVEGRFATVEGEKGMGDVTRRGERQSGGHMLEGGEGSKWKGKW